MVKLPWLHCLCNYSYTEYVTKVKDLTYRDIFFPALAEGKKIVGNK